MKESNTANTTRLWAQIAYENKNKITKSPKNQAFSLFRFSKKKRLVCFSRKLSFFSSFYSASSIFHFCSVLKIDNLSSHAYHPRTLTYLPTFLYDLQRHHTRWGCTRCTNTTTVQGAEGRRCVLFRHWRALVPGCWSVCVVVLH